LFFSLVAGPVSDNFDKAGTNLPFQNLHSPHYKLINSCFKR